MRKHIQCHYKNGALLFCTIKSYSPIEANEILDVFNEKGLVSVLEQKSRNLFKVVGKLHLNYDPFVSGSISWSDVIFKMTDTMEILEEKMKPIDSLQTLQLTS